MQRTLLVIAVTSTLLGCSTGDAPADGGGDVAADAPLDASAAFTPATLDQAGKLALWLEATSEDVTLGDGGRVTTWRDKTQHHNDAIGVGLLPAYDVALQAGHDAVHFDDAMVQLQIADSPSLQLGTDPFTVIAVTRVAAFRMFWFEKAVLNDAGTLLGLEFFVSNGGPSDAGAATPSPFAELDNQTGDFVQWGAGNALGDGKLHIVQFRRTAATAIEVAVDDLPPRSQTTSAIDVSVPGQAAVLGSPGGSFAGGAPPGFWIAEELVLHAATGTLADADVANVYAYLQKKYGL